MEVGSSLVEIIFTTQETIRRKIFLNGSVHRREHLLNRMGRLIGGVNIMFIKIDMMVFTWIINQRTMTNGKK